MHGGSYLSVVLMYKAGALMSVINMYGIYLREKRKAEVEAKEAVRKAEREAKAARAAAEAAAAAAAQQAESDRERMEREALKKAKEAGKKEIKALRQRIRAICEGGDGGIHNSTVWLLDCWVHGGIWIGALLMTAIVSDLE